MNAVCNAPRRAGLTICLVFTVALVTTRGGLGIGHSVAYSISNRVMSQAVLSN